MLFFGSPHAMRTTLSGSSSVGGGRLLALRRVRVAIAVRCTFKGQCAGGGRRLLLCFWTYSYTHHPNLLRFLARHWQEVWRSHSTRFGLVWFDLGPPPEDRPRGQNSDMGSDFLPQRFFIGLGHSCGAKIATWGVIFCLRGFSWDLDTHAPHPDDHVDDPSVQRRSLASLRAPWRSITGGCYDVPRRVNESSTIVTNVL